MKSDSFTVGMVIGFVLGVVLGVFQVFSNEDKWENDAIANGCAQYNPETAVFEWRSDERTQK